MKFVGFDFNQLTPPFQITFQPSGWQDSLTASVARSTAQARTRLLPPDKPGVKPLTPIALTWNPGASLPSLPASQVINSLVTAAGPSITKTTTATQLPQVLSQRAQVLSYHGMDEVMCAGFMIASFEYQFTDTPTTPPVQASDFEAIKQASSQDVVVATAYNLAKRKHAQTKLTMVHNKSKKKDENLDQVHTEQLLCAQLDAFLDTLKANARQCGIVNVHGRWAFKKEVDQKGFDFGKLSINTRIVFEHVDGNVRTDCAACSTTIKNLTTKWGGVCKAFDVAVTKGS